MGETSLFQRLGYIGAASALTRDTRLAMLGLPYDGTASYRAGQRFAPDQIRLASQGNLETYDPIFDDDLAAHPFADIGDLYLEFGMDAGSFVDYERRALASLPATLRVVALGGEHTVSYALVQRALQQHPDLGLLVFDAHTDLRDSYGENRWSHACVMRRIQEILDPDRIAMVGVRSGLRGEFELARRGNLLFPATDAGFHDALRKLGGRPLYISFDLDGFDPAELPGTGTPEAGGFSWVDVSRWLPELKKTQVVAADVVELLPDADPTGRSTVLAARLARMLLLLVLNS